MKKIHRFLLPLPPDKTETIVSNPETIHLMNTVLRLSVGEQCIVFADGTADYLSTITASTKKTVTLRTDSIIPQKVLPKKVTACVSIIKRDNFEIVVQKLTELGIHTIVPIVSERTVKQALRIDRLQKISDEALEQSGGSTRVTISEPKNLADTLALYTGLEQYCFDMEGQPLSHSSKNESVFYIGPEGGWSNDEKSLFKSHGVTICTLGGTTLRAETAAIVAGYTLLWN